LGYTRHAESHREGQPISKSRISLIPKKEKLIIQMGWQYVAAQTLRKKQHQCKIKQLAEQ
jgi:hypothetical protein